METIEAIKSRRSIRRYSEKPVEFEKITTILEAGTYAPSAGNLQDWRFIIVSEKPLIKQVSEYCIEQYWINTAPVLIIVCANPEKHEMYYGLRGKRLYNVQDCAAAIQNMMLTATDLGLGSCWIGAFEEDKIRSTFGIPTDVRPQAIITIGYTDEIPEEKVIKPIEDVVYFNRYGLRVEKLHIVLRDYSIEWEKQGQKAKEGIHNNIRKIKEQVKKLTGIVFKRKEKK